MLSDDTSISQSKISTLRKPVPATTGQCLLCHGYEGQQIMQEGRFIALRCDCGLTFIDPAPDDLEVDPLLDPHHRAYYSKPAKARAAWVRKFKDQGLLLDVGCGHGEFARAAMAEGFVVEGMEPAESRANLTESSLGIKVYREFIENNDLPKNHYDIVFHVDMLSHFPDPIKSLVEMGKLLKPDGALCFEVGLHDILSPFWHQFIGRGNMPAHRWFYSREAVKQVLDQAGFKLIDMQDYNIGLSNMLSTILLSIFKPDVISGKSGMTVKPMASGPVSNLYYAFHMWLRYSVGRWTPNGGPKTTLVTAVLKH